jgi:hypothetical protein
VLGDVIDQEDYVGSYYNRDSLSTIHVRCEPAPPPQQAAAGDGDGEEELGAGSDESSSNIDMPKLLIRSESGPADFIADWQEDDDDEWLGDEDTEVSNSAPPPPFLPFPISSLAKLRLFTKTGSGQTVRKEIPRYKRAFVSHTRAGE